MAPRSTASRCRSGRPRRSDAPGRCETPVKEEARQDGAASADFLTARQLASVLQVSESTVRRLARSGRIPSIRITPHILRFRLASVVEALDGTAARARRPARTRPDDNGSDDTQLSFFE